MKAFKARQLIYYVETILLALATTLLIHLVCATRGPQQGFINCQDECWRASHFVYH